MFSSMIRLYRRVQEQERFAQSQARQARENYMANRLLTIEQINDLVCKRVNGMGLFAPFPVEIDPLHPLVLKFGPLSIGFRTEDLLMSDEDFTARIIDPLLGRISKTGIPRPEEVRGGTHGDYTRMSEIAQFIKGALERGKNWTTMPAYQRETLELEATKFARIVEGDASCYDHWDDARGYLQLVLDRMTKPHA